MKSTSITVIILIISSLLLTPYVLGQNIPIQKNYLNYYENSDGSISNLSYINKVIINSITFTPSEKGARFKEGIVSNFVSDHYKEKIFNTKSPIIDIQGNSHFKIKIVFNNFSIQKAISFNGFFIDDINSVAFIKGANFSILNSTVTISTINNFYVKIFIENNKTIGEISQYIHTREFNGILYLNHYNLTYDFVNTSLSISSYNFQEKTFSFNFNLTNVYGFFIIVMNGFDNPLNIVVNGVLFKNTTLNNVAIGDSNSYDVNYLNGTYIYFLYISNLTKSSTNIINENLPLIVLITIITVVIISGAIAINKMVKK
ncbi:MAG: hypothetical protein ACP5SF_04845 [Thermoplasmata archaeon]